jgi:hypothetical protein
MAFLSPFRGILGYYLEIGHIHFLPLVFSVLHLLIILPFDAIVSEVIGSLTK